MAQLSPWLIGRNVLATVTPLIEDAAGNLTDDATASLQGHLREITLQSPREVEEISPMDLELMNEVVLKKGMRLTLVEILKRTDINILAAINFAGANYVRVNIIRGGRNIGIIGVVTDYSETMQRGQGTGTMTLGPVDPNVTNPTYTTA